MSAELARRLAAMGIRDERVLEVVAGLERADFVPPDVLGDLDGNWPLPIGFGQTISQPYIVAFMTAQLRLCGDERVLEVGTGSGYQTAVLSRLARAVFSVEIVPELGRRAAALLLGALGLRNVSLREGDGALGWPEEAPFDRILVAAATPEVPPALRAQLAPGGRLILPVGEDGRDQVLRLVQRRRDGSLAEADVLPVRFVPLTHGRAWTAPSAVDSGR